MFKKTKRTIFLCLLVIISLTYCSRKIENPVSDLGEVAVPPTPKNISLSIGDGKVNLAWETNDSSNISYFKIYRADTSTVNPSLIDSCTVFEYNDTGLKNNKQYFYQVSSVDAKGFEGYKSEKASARPNLFSITINGGQRLTNDVDVSLSLVVPSGSSYMMISNDSLFSSSSWERCSSTKNWQLEIGDGEKWVYAKFRDSEGNDCAGFYKSSIILDTRAYIYSLLENTDGQVKTTGDTIHFALESDETNGQAKIDLGSISNIILYDNGQFGDVLANDGKYELDYIIPLDVEMNEAVVKGHFTDEAGNIASVVTAPGRVTIQDNQPPHAVSLAITSINNDSAVVLSWSENTDSDFESYRVYKSEADPVTINSNVVKIINQKSTTTFTDEDVQPDSLYYYKVFVFDKAGLYTPSNQVSGP